VSQLFELGERPDQLEDQLGILLLRKMQGEPGIRVWIFRL